VNTIRVLLDTTWAAGTGGTARYVSSLHEALVVRPDVEVIAVSAPRLTSVRRAVRMPLNGVLHLVWTQVLLPVLAWRHRVDVVQATMTAPVMSPRPVVLTLHDALDFMPVLLPSQAWSRYMRTVGALAARRAAVVVTGTRASAAEIVRYYRVAPERVRVTAYGSALVGVELGEDRASCPVVLSRSEGPPRVSRPGGQGGEVLRCGSGRQGFVLMVGAADRRKDIGTGLRAVAMVREAGVEIAAVVVGSVPDAFAEEAWVTVVTRVSDPELAWLYEYAVAVLVTSRHEGYGLPVVEAQACGTPVVVSDLPALREVGGGAARYAPIGDAAAFARELAQIVDRPEEERAQVARASSASGGPTWTATANATVAIYRELLGRGT